VALGAAQALCQPNTGDTGGGPNTGETGGGNIAAAWNASIANKTNSRVAITLTDTDEDLTLQPGETRDVSCTGAIRIGKAKDKPEGKATKPIDLIC
jgi:hypothetical protein